MSVLTCKLQDALESRLADLAGRRGVPNSVLVREAIESKIAEEAAGPRRPPANLIEALGDSVGSIVSGKRDLARNKKHLQRPCRRPRAPRAAAYGDADICVAGARRMPS